MNTSVNTDNKPWYRYPLVWMMIVIPFSAIVMGVIMLWLALDTDDGLVADDYYKQGLEINRVLERDKKSTELGLSASLDLDNENRVINLRFNKGLLEQYPQQLQLEVQHATRANSDVVLMLERGIDDHYIGYLSEPLNEGIWYFELADADWKLNARIYVRANTSVKLESHVQ